MGLLIYLSIRDNKSGKTALEAKETPTKEDTNELSALSQIAGLEKFRLIGRFPSPGFKNYIWGGAIK